MKKVLIVALIIILGSAGFLAYDWHVKTTLREDDQRVTLYSWTDENGARHYTNTQPPEGARNIEERKGYKYTDQPLVLKIKNSIIDGYRWVQEKVFKKKDPKKKR
jgi:heme-degrading monooxygenase HmoA